MYLPLYDLMAERWAPAWWAPLAAGSAARTVAVLSTSPLELVRTRMQARAHAQPAAHDVEHVCCRVSLMSRLPHLARQVKESLQCCATCTLEHSLI